MRNETKGSRRRFLTAGAMGAVGILAPGRHASASRQLPARPEGPDDASWAQVRAAFALEPGTAYLNNASLGMPPGVVAEAVARGYDAVSREPLHGKHDLQQVVAERVMPGLAAMLGADASELALTRNATEALHMAAVSRRLQPGDEVLTTTQEHPAGIRPWRARAAHDGIIVHEVFVPSPLVGAEDVIERFEAARTSRTRAVAFCHVTRGGHRYPAAEIAAWARSRGLVSIVDGAQAVGMTPVDLHQLGCDAYSASLHKWVLGPIGTGFLYVRQAARDRFESTVDPEPDAGYVIGGTADLPLRAALGTALAFLDAIGTDRVFERCRALSDDLKSRLVELDRVTLLSGPRELSAPGSTIFAAAGVDPFVAVPWFERHASMHIDEHVRDGHQAIRVSTHVYNTQDEIGRFVAALERAIAEGVA